MFLVPFIRKDNNISINQLDSAAKPRRRLGKIERERLIIEEAINFFAEVGFEGRTRELAKRLGVTQPLLYRYFPTKELLIERVYQEIYIGRLKPEWTALILDQSLPLRQRLLTFYTEYQRAISNYEWVRIFMFAGLKGVGINERYLNIIEERILKPICSEIRQDLGLPDVLQVPISPIEMELVWRLHGSIFYREVRKWIYNLPIPDVASGALEQDIDVFLATAPDLLAQIIAEQTKN